MCQLLDVMKFHLEAFGVQIYPFLSTGDNFLSAIIIYMFVLFTFNHSDKLPHLAYFSYNALPWGLAALGVFTGSKLLLLPILV